MNLASQSGTKALLQQIGVRPSKALGQNFLIDRNILNILVNTASLSPSDSVLEIGPGLGIVTEELLRAAGRVAAVEKDGRLFGFLKDRFKDEERLELLCEDILDVDIENLLGPPPPDSKERVLNKVVGNLPYSVAGRILAALAISRFPPAQITATVQHEVAARLAARPGNKDYGTLSVWLQRVYRVAVVKIVSPTCFWPVPEVKSAIVNMTRLPLSVASGREREMFFDLTKRAFMHRRKQLATILSRAASPCKMPLSAATGILEELKLDAKARPEDLSAGDWTRLAEALERKSRTV